MSDDYEQKRDEALSLIQAASYENCDTKQIQLGVSGFTKAQQAIDQLVQHETLMGRLFELDLFEQALNQGWSMENYKLARLDDLTKRLNQLTNKSKTTTP